MSAVLQQAQLPHAQGKFLALVMVSALETLLMSACVATDGWGLTVLSEYVRREPRGSTHQRPQTQPTAWQNALTLAFATGRRENAFVELGGKVHPASTKAALETRVVTAMASA